MYSINTVKWSQAPLILLQKLSLPPNWQGAKATQRLRDGYKKRKLPQDWEVAGMCGKERMTIVSAICCNLTHHPKTFCLKHFIASQNWNCLDSDICGLMQLQPLKWTPCFPEYYYSTQSDPSKPCHVTFFLYLIQGPHNGLQDPQDLNSSFPPLPLWPPVPSFILPQLTSLQSYLVSCILWTRSLSLGPLHLLASPLERLLPKISTWFTFFKLLFVSLTQLRSSLTLPLPPTLDGWMWMFSVQ